MITKAIEMILFDEGCSEEEISFIDSTSTEDFIKRYGYSSEVQDDSRADSIRKQLKNT